jgi:hypothetical protein
MNDKAVIIDPWTPAGSFKPTTRAVRQLKKVAGSPIATAILN